MSPPLRNYSLVSSLHFHYYYTKFNRRAQGEKEKFVEMFWAKNFI